MMQAEIWKPIKGYEGLYEVSNHGRIRNFNTRKVLTPKKHNRGYYHVILFRNGAQKSFLVHRLVALAFVPTADETLTVNHIDEDKLNNRAENLEWCSVAENVRLYQKNHAQELKGKLGRKEDKTPIRQLTKQGVVLKVWSSAAEARRALQCSNTWAISQCCKNKRKTAYGYKWQYAT